MIFLWFKIMYYKMIKLLGRKTRAEAGEKSGASRVRVEHDPAQPVRHEGGESETSGEVLGVAFDPAIRDGLVLYGRQPGAPSGEIRTARLRELIEKGLVRYPDEAGDLYRVAALEDDRAQRERIAMETGYPGACPCGGRHYPSPYSCRWCRCHDLRNEHHRPDALGLMQVIERPHEEDHANPGPLMDTRPSNEIVCCPRCGHPQHPGNGGRCAFLVPMAAGGALHYPTCGCVTESEA